MEPPPGISNREVRKEHKYGKEIKLRMEKSGKKMNDDKSLVDKVVMGERLDLAEIICPICMCVLISPVQMPCQHVLCLPCFQVKKLKLSPVSTNKVKYSEVRGPL